MAHNYLWPADLAPAAIRSGLGPWSHRHLCLILRNRTNSTNRRILQVSPSGYGAAASVSHLGFRDPRLDEGGHVSMGSHGRAQQGDSGQGAAPLAQSHP